MTPDEAVVAAAKVIYADNISNHAGDNAPQIIDACERVARKVLEAVAPHLIATRKPKPGEGDYAPSWDDRKKLAEVWQGKAPLPKEGLSERVYEALIEVAAWGYQQRVDEDL